MVLLLDTALRRHTAHIRHLKQHTACLPQATVLLQDTPPLATLRSTPPVPLVTVLCDLLRTVYKFRRGMLVPILPFLGP